MISFPFKLIDLTHPLEETIPTWDGGCSFHLEERHGDGYCAQGFKMAAGIGTHIDAPYHFFRDGKTIDQLSDGVAPAVLIEGHTLADLEKFEKAHGPISPGSFVIMKTGWEKYWGQPELYRLFPTVSKEAAEFLLKRKILGLGVDTLSPDGPGSDFPVHKLLLGAGVVIVENAANLDVLPPRGWFILFLPIKIKGGAEAPMRLIALIEDMV